MAGVPWMGRKIHRSPTGSTQVLFLTVRGLMEPRQVMWRHRIIMHWSVISEVEAKPHRSWPFPDPRGKVSHLQPRKEKEREGNCSEPAVVGNPLLGWKALFLWERAAGSPSAPVIACKGRRSILHSSSPQQAGRQPHRKCDICHLYYSHQKPRNMIINNFLLHFTIWK